MESRLRFGVGAGIGTRVVATVVLLTAAVLVIAGFTEYSISRTSLENTARHELDQAADELEVLVTKGVNPATGKRFDNANDLLEVAVQRSVLGRHEGQFAVVDGRIAWLAPEAVPLRLEDDQALVDTTLRLSSGEQILQGQLRSGERVYQFIVIPVSYPDGSTGAMVRAVDLAPEYAELNGVFRIYAVVGALAVMVVGLVIWLLLGRLLAPLTLVRQTAEHLAASDSDFSERIPVHGNDELSALTGTINGMLDRLENAVTTQKKLTDDVSHELRTPLTIMRGNLELLDPKDPELVAETRQTLMQVVDRMDRLVEDLLTLARAERPQFLSRRPTDVAELTDEVAELARALGDRQWKLDHLAEAIVDLDPNRISQAMLQLASNAVRYSDPGSPVTIGSRVVGDEVHLYVRDQGIGIAEDQLDIITTRFGRAGNAPQNSDKGFGLGLAIVDAIVRAHGGHLMVRSTEGVGSVFTLCLPREGHHELNPDR